MPENRSDHISKACHDPIRPRLIKLHDEYTFPRHELPGSAAVRKALRRPCSAALTAIQEFGVGEEVGGVRKPRFAVGHTRQGADDPILVVELSQLGARHELLAASENMETRRAGLDQGRIDTPRASPSRTQSWWPDSTIQRRTLMSMSSY